MVGEADSLVTGYDDLNDFETLEEAREVIGAFIERYNRGWLLQRHGYLTPARAREKLSRRAA
ncbi:hypothetical protein [Candidatus Palauibacter sp.]|uniref:hypothetical protein n=1 Tax=Candidatus Palauibacter sp. TaxID=3101350 RepID=UPI003CC5EF2E